tara:strand:- start:6189 stop:6512 length:324 start_codon:yes stop_codon:yes gene_type:complete
MTNTDPDNLSNPILEADPEEATPQDAMVGRLKKKGHLVVATNGNLPDIIRVTDPRMSVFKPSAWAKWRVTGAGPRYFKIGGKVLYRWSDVREWLLSTPVEPTAEGQA